VDFDTVSESNLNRQVVATAANIGAPKVEEMKKRLLRIMPDADITAINLKYDDEMAEEFPLTQYDYIIDAIDSLADKALLIGMATRTKAFFVSSMGAALKMDPRHIQVAEFWKVKGCPLARALRQRFKKEKAFPARKFQCVFSDELLKNKPEEVVTPSSDAGTAAGRQKPANGSLVHITGIFGFTLAALVTEHLVTPSAKNLP
jgi:tRNA A37 threonylcarbamoyladenosine dehydratase